MDITTLLFFVFVALLAIVYYVVPNKCKWIVLLFGSIIFFVSNSALLTILMILSTIIVFFGGIYIQKLKNEFNFKKKELNRTERKALKSQYIHKQNIILTICITLVISLLVFTKYINMVGGLFNSLLGVFGVNSLIPTFNILVPIGISYYTLMSISYIVDVKRGSITAEQNPFKLLLFISYFPHIVEGPFDRYNDLSEQFGSPKTFNLESISNAILIILFGLMKKLVVANRIAPLVSEIFENVNSYSGTAIAVGTVLYTLQLYMDFSGCINIVSGVSLLFGIRIAKNFDLPFLSKTVNEFWQRWHISLGAWLKEYIFYPVSLSKRFKKINTFCSKKISSKYLSSVIPLGYALFFVWFIMGIWHGASLKFILYGLYYYFIMMIGRLTEPISEIVKSKLNISNSNKMFIFFQIVRTFAIVNVGMLLFRTETVRGFISLLLRMFTSFNVHDSISYAKSKSDLVIIFTLSLIVFVVEFIKNKDYSAIQKLKSNSFVKMISILLLIAVVSVMGMYGVEFGEVGALYGQF